MIREEAKIKFDLARSGAFGQYRRNEMLKVIDEIFDEHEAELKAKDERIAELEEMVQKMKCCENCNHNTYYNNDCEWGQDIGCNLNVFEQWQLKGIK